MQPELAVKRLRPGAAVPTYATPGAAGLDLVACLDSRLLVEPGQTVLVPTGLAVAIPPGYVGLVRDRSSVALAGLHTVAGVIDSDYRGEVMIAVHNAGAAQFTIRPGDRVAQMPLLECAQAAVSEVEELPPTERGAGGFGSTGR